jgi:hypothetical protein
MMDGGKHSMYIGWLKSGRKYMLEFKENCKAHELLGIEHDVKTFSRLAGTARALGRRRRDSLMCISDIVGSVHYSRRSVGIVSAIWQCLALEAVIDPEAKIWNSGKYEDTGRPITTSRACYTAWRAEVPICCPALGAGAVKLAGRTGRRIVSVAVARVLKLPWTMMRHRHTANTGTWRREEAEIAPATRSVNKSLGGSLSIRVALDVSVAQGKLATNMMT